MGTCSTCTLVSPWHVRCDDCGEQWWGADAETRARSHFFAQPEEQPERRDLPVEDTYGVLGLGFVVADRIRDYHRDGVQAHVKELLDTMQPTAAMIYTTAREVAEEKVKQLLDWDAPTRALAFAMLRNQGMDTDTARRILREAKWDRT